MSQMGFPPVPGFDTADYLRRMADRVALEGGRFDDIKGVILAAQEIEAYRLRVANLVTRLHALETGVAVRIDASVGDPPGHGAA